MRKSKGFINGVISTVITSRFFESVNRSVIATQETIGGPNSEGKKL